MLSVSSSVLCGLLSGKQKRCTEVKIRVNIPYGRNTIVSIFRSQAMMEMAALCLYIT